MRRPPGAAEPTPAHLADLYRQLPDDRRRDLRDKSAATSVVIGRYIEALLDQDDLGNAGWLLLQVLVCLLLHSSVSNAIDALERARTDVAEDAGTMMERVPVKSVWARNRHG